MKLILIGSSTGGPNQLKFLLKDIDVKNTCVVIAQHMSASFIPSFVGQFNKEAFSEVCLLNDKEILSNKIYICPKNTILSGNLNIVAAWQDVASSFKPSVDLLFHSAVSLAKTNKILAIILTGMGDDGAKVYLSFIKQELDVYVRMKQIASFMVCQKSKRYESAFKIYELKRN